MGGTAFDTEGLFTADASQLIGEASDAGRAIEGVGSSAQEAERDADRAASSITASLGSIGQSAQRVGGLLTAGVTLPLVAVAGTSVNTASRIEEMLAKSGQVFRDLTGEVRAWADATAEAMNRSAFQLEGMAVNFADLLVPMGATRDEAVTMSQNLTELTQDLASFNDMPTAQVAQNVQSALVGQSEAVRKYGVDVSQAAVNQELLNMGIEGGADAATRMQEVQARMNILMEDTADAQGDAVRTSDSFANQMRGLRAATEELQVKIGQKLMPVARDLVDVAQGGIDAFQGLSDEQQRMLVIAGGAAAVLGPLAAGLGTILALAPAVAAGFGLISAAAAPITIALVGGAAAVGLLAAAWETNFLGIQQITNQAIGAVMDMFDDLVTAGSFLVDSYITIWERILDATADFIDAIPGVNSEDLIGDIDEREVNSILFPPKPGEAGEEAGAEAGEGFTTGMAGAGPQGVDTEAITQQVRAGMVDVGGTGGPGDVDVSQIVSDVRAEAGGAGDREAFEVEVITPSGERETRVVRREQAPSAVVRETAGGQLIGVSEEQAARAPSALATRTAGGSETAGLDASGAGLAGGTVEVVIELVDDLLDGRIEQGAEGVVTRIERRSTRIQDRGSNP